MTIVAVEINFDSVVKPCLVKVMIVEVCDVTYDV